MQKAELHILLSLFCNCILFKGHADFAVITQLFSPAHLDFFVFFLACSFAALITGLISFVLILSREAAPGILIDNC